MKAILIGATGLIGSLLLEKLLRDPVFTHIRLISRNPCGIKNEKLDEVLINFEEETQFKEAVTAADVLFCCIGTTQKKVKGDKTAYRKIDFDIPVKAAIWCAEKNVGKYLLVSSVGADAAGKNPGAPSSGYQPTFNFIKPGGVAGHYYTLDPINSRWQGQFGVKYNF